jgi:Domain of unknown function (DUF4157)
MAAGRATERPTLARCWTFARADESVCSVSRMPSFEHQRDEDLAAPERAKAAGPASPDAAVERLASSVGNQAFGVLARAGAGIMPDGTAHPDVTAAIARRRGAGMPLDEQTRGHFEKTLEHDFGNVRVHTGNEPDSLARSVDARAFTLGKDIYFAAGEFQPASGEGRRLLGHELAHVIQQEGAPTSGPVRVSKPGEPLEQEADAAGRRGAA